jgi:hypothetical protein
MAIINGGEQIFAALFEAYGPTLTFDEAAKILKFSSIKTAYTARSRGRFPLRTLDLGGRLGVSVADLAAFLQTGQPQTESQAVQMAKRPGRPRKHTKPIHRDFGGSHG